MTSFTFFTDTPESLVGWSVDHSVRWLVGWLLGCFLKRGDHASENVPVKAALAIGKKS